MNPSVIGMAGEKGGGPAAPRDAPGKYIRVWMPAPLLERIIKKQRELGLASISEAIRYFVNKGLEEVDP